MKRAKHLHQVRPHVSTHLSREEKNHIRAYKRARKPPLGVGCRKHVNVKTKKRQARYSSLEDCDEEYRHRVSRHYDDQRGDGARHGEYEGLYEDTEFEEERRLDVGPKQDGNAYTYAEFLECYGDEARHW